MSIGVSPLPIHTPPKPTPALPPPLAVDAKDTGRLPEAKRELDSLLTSDELCNVPFLVLGNKIDMPGAMSEDQLKYELGMVDTYGKETRADANPNIRPIELYMCSVARRMGYADGFKWLSQFLS